jgi:hypothetical protein
MKGVFVQKEIAPTTRDLQVAIGETASIWHELESLAKSKFPTATAGLKFSGEKFGWGSRISDSKRVIVYLKFRTSAFKKRNDQ